MKIRQETRRLMDERKVVLLGVGHKSPRDAPGSGADTLEAQESHALPTCRIGKMKSWGTSGARALAGIRHREAEEDRLAAADLEVAIGEARVAEAVAEGVERLRIILCTDMCHVETASAETPQAQ